MPQKVVVIDANKLVLEEFRRGPVRMIRAKRMPVDTGVPGVHVEFSYSVVPDGYFTPSHRHNIDQMWPSFPLQRGNEHDLQQNQKHDSLVRGMFLS